jgi:hypothetical protein
MRLILHDFFATTQEADGALAFDLILRINSLLLNFVPLPFADIKLMYVVEVSASFASVASKKVKTVFVSYSSTT